MKILQAPNFRDFRQAFRAKLGRNFIVPANSFDNVKGQFPIGFFIWDTNQKEVFEAAILFSQTEGIVPAPESAHAIKGAIEEALAAREEGKSRTILFGLSGHGFLDLGAYDNYLAGKLIDAPCPQSELAENLQCLPKI